ncbi:MAG: ABC transporter permease, partial [Verrucomicrobiota bacterium]|nr:ABC transporter permease [Verrucomicrobiota bacterium]
RYLQPKRTFVSVITLISVLGVTLGIAVLIVVIAVMTGFDQELRRKVLGFDAHLLITSESVLHEWRELDEQVQKLPPVVASAPFVQGPVIVEFQGRRLAPKIRGIDVEREQKVTDVRNAIVEGELDLGGDHTVMGIQLATQLGVGVGDKVIVYSPGNIGALIDELNKAEKDPDKAKAVAELREMVLPAELTVTGIFESGRYMYDAEFLLVPLHVGQELYGLGDDLHGLTIRTEDPYRAPELKEALFQLIAPGQQVYTWIDLNKQLFDAIKLERNTMFVILFFIVIVAAFGIMNTLITVTVQKTREIGIMKALGANTAQIVWVFLAQGMVVGFFGNITGIAAGMALVRWRNEFKQWLAETLRIEIFPPGIYQFSEIPAEVVPGDVALICVTAFIICALAALIPAYFAARLDPVKALRYE